MIKNIILIIVVPFIILAANDFETMGFVVAGFYLLYYFAQVHPEPSSNNTTQLSPKELERRRKEGYNAWLEKNRKEKLEKSSKVDHVALLKKQRKAIEEEAAFQLMMSKIRATKVNKAPKTIKDSLKFSMSQNEFETEINTQLNKIRGGRTKILWVGDEHRTHPWSLQPGGCTVVVLFKNRTCLGYDKVKRPDRYTQKITKDFISNHYSNQHISSLEQYINEIYLTSDRGMDLKKVWHSNMHQSPWGILEQYRTK